MKRSEAELIMNSGRWSPNGLFRKAAIRCLRKDGSGDGYEVLAQALLKADRPVAKQIHEAMQKHPRQAHVDRLWRIWAESRQEEWGQLLQGIGIMPTDPELHRLAILKLSRERELPTDYDCVDSIRCFANDPDREVRLAVCRYVECLRLDHIESFYYFCLVNGDFGRIGFDRDRIDSILTFLANPRLAPGIERYRQQLPGMSALYWDLQLNQLEKISLTPDAPWELIEYLDDADSVVRERALQVMERLRSAEPDTWLLIMLKMRRSSELKQNPRTIQAVLRYLEQGDEDVCETVLEYIRALPNDDLRNEILFATLLSSELPALRTELEAAGRLPPSHAVRALYFLLTDQCDAYLALGDQDGELFLEAWLIASEDQRRRINETIVKSRNEALIKSYEQALACRDDYDIELHLEALSSAGLDEQLFALLEQCQFAQALRLIERWCENGWRPSDDAGRNLIETAIAAYAAIEEKVLPEEGTPPIGCQGLIEHWNDSHVEDTELLDQFASDDVVLRARAIYLAGHRGLLDRDALLDAERSDHWLVRYAATHSAKPFRGCSDHVYWVNALRADFGPLLEASIRCTPDDYDRNCSLVEEVKGRPGAIMGRARGLLELAVFLQRYYCTGIELIDDDHPTDSHAVEIEDAPLEEAFA